MDGQKLKEKETLLSKRMDELENRSANRFQNRLAQKANRLFFWSKKVVS